MSLIACDSVIQKRVMDGLVTVIFWPFARCSFHISKTLPVLPITFPYRHSTNFVLDSYFENSTKVFSMSNLVAP